MTCQWLFGEPTNRNFCGLPGTPWCKLHRKIVYRPSVEVNTFGIEAKQPPAGFKPSLRGLKPKPDSIAQKIRKALLANPDIVSTDLAQQLGCSAHHVRKVRRAVLGKAAENNKAEKIRRKIEEGLKDNDVAREIGCSPAYVRAVRYRMKEAIQ